MKRAILWLAVALAAAAAPLEAQGPLPDDRIDPNHIYRIRDITLRRDVLSISLTRGTIAFFEPVEGRVTGAFFSGSGGIVALLPGEIEREQLRRYTGAAALNEPFDAAILHFTDDTFQEILEEYRQRAQEDVAPAEAAGLITRYETLQRPSPAVRHRMLADLLAGSGPSRRPFFLARLHNAARGWFDARYDRRLDEEIRIGSARGNAGRESVWASFNERAAPQSLTADGKRPVEAAAYDVDATLHPDLTVDAVAWVRLRATADGQRALTFRLAPSLRVTSAFLENGRELAVIQDAVADGARIQTAAALPFTVVLPEALGAGEETVVRVVYSGHAIERTGGEGVSRPYWHPILHPEENVRLSLTVHFAPEMTFLASGEQVREWESEGRRHAVWNVSGRDNGFYIGPCRMFEADGVTAISACLPVHPGGLVHALLAYRWALENPAGSSGAFDDLDMNAVGAAALQAAGAAAGFLSRLLGYSPYDRLTLSFALTENARSGPALMYVSMLPYLARSYPDRIRPLPEAALTRAEYVFVRETARQWFGRNIVPAGERDAWVVAGLAAYAALMYLEETHTPAQSNALLDRARRALLEISPEGVPYADLGPASIGLRLAGPGSTDGYIDALENKSVWILHALRTRMTDAAFSAMLRTLGERFRDTAITTDAFKRIAEEHAGESLDGFFAQWVFSPGFPE